MVDEYIETILKKTLGLKITSIGSSTVDRAVNRRMKALGLTEKLRYLAILRSYKEELRLLIEEVVVPETWFFRDEKSYSALKQFGKERLSVLPKQGVLRVLSSPCSTGEEPYSIAMTLLQAGVPESLFRVEAVDISRRSLSWAKAATYGDNSFRSTDLSFRSMYFKKTDSKYVLRDNVRKSVSFHFGNLLDPQFMTGLGLFDVIFCRNLLIYLDQNAQKQTLDTLESLLVTGGLLFVGHTEAAAIRSTNLSVANNYSTAFAFMKKPFPAENCDRETSTGTIPAVFPALSKVIAPDHPYALPFSQSVKLVPVPPAIHALETAKLLADQGHLVEATQQCEACLREQGPSARGYFLLGLIRDSAGFPEEALALFRKVLYLEPDHLEALAHLSLLVERMGDKVGAEAFRKRAERIKERVAIRVENAD